MGAMYKSLFAASVAFGCAAEPPPGVEFADAPFEGCDIPRIAGTPLLLVDEMLFLEPVGGDYVGFFTVRNGGEAPMGVQLGELGGNEGVLRVDARPDQQTGDEQVPWVLQPGDEMKVRVLAHGTPVRLGHVNVASAALPSHGALMDPYVLRQSVGILIPGHAAQEEDHPSISSARCGRSRKYTSKKQESAWEPQSSPRAARCSPRR